MLHQVFLDKAAQNAEVIDQLSESLELIAAARKVHEAGETLHEGDIVMAGGVTAAEPLSSGQHVRLSVQRLGTVEFHVQSD